jgi:hypothetical protein
MKVFGCFIITFCGMAMAFQVMETETGVFEGDSMRSVASQFCNVNGKGSTDVPS